MVTVILYEKDCFSKQRINKNRFGEKLSLLFFFGSMEIKYGRVHSADCIKVAVTHISLWSCQRF